MNRIFNLLFSTRTTLVLLLIFATALATATFIEDSYDTITANMLVYKAKWFELVMLLLALNFIGNIKRHNLFRKEKLAVLVFHLAFILMIVGAAVTRYIGFEAMMSIREGGSSNQIYSAEPYLMAYAGKDSLEYSLEKQKYFSSAFSNNFDYTLDCGKDEKIGISYKNYLYNGIETINTSSPEGSKILELIISTPQGRELIYLPEKGMREIGDVRLAFNHGGKNNDIHIISMGGGLRLISGEVIRRNKMGEMNALSQTDTSSLHDVELVTGDVYETHGISLFMKFYYPNAVMEWEEGSEGDNGIPALLVNVNYKGKNQEVALLGGMDNAALFSDIMLGDLKLKIGYGAKAIQLPFSIHLNDFILERYAGSMSPSSYASEVSLIDPRKNLKENHRIYMNHVLDYDGYRFFQSSYPKDEKGTILSVNHDFWGTWLSYLSYAMLTLGFILSLFNRSSRFVYLNRKISEVRSFRKTGLISLILLAGFTGFAQSPVQKPVSADHAEKFGKILVQSFEGRFQPMHTMTVDVMHKISRMDGFDLEGKGKLNPSQAFLDMILDPDYWKNQKIIYIREKSVAEELGVNGKYACFNDFIDQSKNYKLSEHTEKAFRKKGGQQNLFDKEVIKLDEWVNVFMMVLNGSLLKVFPSEHSINNKWLTLEDTLAQIELTGKAKSLTEYMGLEKCTYNNVLRFYLMNLYEASLSGDYTKADKALETIDKLQRELSPPDLLPSPSMVDYEIFYNTSNIFGFLKNWYGVISLVLLTLAFIENFRKKKSRLVSVLLAVFIGFLALGFLYHTLGLGLRWYLSGHAPWSNGYEALILIAWAGVLAGFIFIRNSKITLAATALLAFSVLMTAGHSSYDPQLTNLQPVLKSYWLIIHVAVITISYGFLALGFVLGLINLVIYLFTTTKNFNRFNLVVKELTHINEMSLIIGLILATIGTFLGGVWANESWGRYWGWDAKETWALIIVMTYSIILHFRFVPALRGLVTFNVASIIGFGSVLMTFIGVNYYLSKGLHSYAAGDTPVFPVWAWVMIFAVIGLIVAAGFKENSLALKMEQSGQTMNPDEDENEQ